MSDRYDQGTCVILVCLTNKHNKILTHDKFFKTFGIYGKILRILIFERAIIWKTFIEFDNPESAVKARVSMNGTEFGEDHMKTSVYASQFVRITFQDNNSGGVGNQKFFDQTQDYTILRQKIEEKNLQGFLPATTMTMNQSNNNQINSSNNKSLSQSTSPIKINQSLQNQQTYMTNSLQNPQLMDFQNSLSYVPHLSQSLNQNQYNQDIEMIKHQTNIYQRIQQQIQNANQLMFMLQQVNGEQQYQIQSQFNQSSHKEYNLQLIEKQQQLIKDLKGTQINTSSQLEKYQSMLSSWHNMRNSSKKQEILQMSFPVFGKESLSSSSDELNQLNVFTIDTETSPQKSHLPYGNNLSTLVKSQNTSQNMSNINPIFIKPVITISESTLNQDNLSTIQFIKSFDGDSTADQRDIDNIINDEDQANQYKKDHKIQFNNSKLRLNNTEKDYQTSTSIIKNKQMIQQNLARADDQEHNLSVIKKSDVEMHKDLHNQQIFAQFDCMVNDSNLKSTKSAEKIDLINQSKLKQKELENKNSQKGFSQTGSPIWSQSKTSESIQLNEDIKHYEQKGKNLPIRQKIQQNNYPQGQQTRFLEQTNTQISDPAEYVSPLFMKLVRKSKVIYARWFDKDIVTIKMLANIFSVYGNIDKMVFLRERSNVLIQFITLEHSSDTKEYLNDVIFYGQQIKIFYSNHEEIYLKNSEKDESEEYYQGNEDQYRYKENITSIINPPSNIIIITNLTKESCNSETLKIIFEPFGRIIKQKYYLNPLSGNSCSFKYEDVETSLIVLANLNGSEIDGQPILISFSKQRI